MNRHDLDLLVARAKTRGDKVWENIKLHFPLEKCYTEFAQACNNFYPPTDTLGNYLMFEMFLRAGKHMPDSMKIDNRRKADKLRDTILKP